MVSDHVERLEKASCKIPCPYLKGATKPYKTSHESCTFQYLEAKKCQDILRRHPISINFSLWVVSDVVFPPSFPIHPWYESGRHELSCVLLYGLKPSFYRCCINSVSHNYCIDRFHSYSNGAKIFFNGSKPMIPTQFAMVPTSTSEFGSENSVWLPVSQVTEGATCLKR